MPFKSEDTYTKIQKDTLTRFEYNLEYPLEPLLTLARSHSQKLQIKNKIMFQDCRTNEKL